MCAAKQHRHQGRLILLIDVFLHFIVFMAVGGDLGRVIGWLAMIIIMVVVVVAAPLCFITCKFHIEMVHLLYVWLNLIGHFLPDSL